MRICDVVGGIGLLKILFAGLLWEGGTRCNDFLIIGQCFALQQRLTLARELKVILLYQPSQTHTIPRKSPTPLPYERSVCFASCKTSGVQLRASMPVPCQRRGAVARKNSGDYRRDCHTYRTLSVSLTPPLTIPHSAPNPSKSVLSLENRQHPCLPCQREVD